MSTWQERPEMVRKAGKIAEGYLNPQERIARSRYHEVVEWRRRQKTLFTLREVEEVRAEFPDGVAADKKFDEVVNDLLLSGKFGQVDWQV